MTDIPLWAGPGTDDSWDALILGGQFIPGVPTVECEMSWKLDIQKPKGADGYKMKDEGLEPANVEISLVLVRQEELTELAKVLPLLRPPKKGGTRDPLEIQHPSAAVAGITAIAIEKIRISQPTAKDGWTITISAKEWMPGPKANKGLGSAKGGGAQSCAALAAQLQQAHYELNKAAVELEIASGGGASGFNVGQKQAEYSKKQAKIGQLQTQLDACAAGAAVPPPSESATQTAATEGLGTDEAALLAAA